MTNYDDMVADLTVFAREHPDMLDAQMTMGYFGFFLPVDDPTLYTTIEGAHRQIEKFTGDWGFVYYLCKSEGKLVMDRAVVDRRTVMAVL